MQLRSEQPFIGQRALITSGLALLVGLATGALVARDQGPALLIVGIIGLASVIGMIARPAWGLMVLVFMTYTRMSDVLVHEHGLPSIAQPFIGFLLLVIIAHWKWGTIRPVSGQRPIILLVIYGLVGLLSFFAATDIDRAHYLFSIFVKDALITWLVVLLCQHLGTLRQAVWALLAAGIWLGTLSVHQQLTGAFYHNYGGFSQAAVQHISGHLNDYRLAGPIGDPNFYAQILLVLLPLALNRVWYERTPVVRGLALWSLVVCGMALIYTFSRGAILALGVMVALQFWHRPPRPLVLLTGLVLLIPMFYILPAQYTSRIQSLGAAAASLTGDGEQDAAMKGRLSENIVGWQIWMDHPFIGVGLGHYPVYYRQYAKQIGIDLRHEDRNAHNLYLQIAAETGLAGLAAFTLIVGFGFRGMYQGYRMLASHGRTGEAELIVALMIGLSGYLVAAIFLHGAFARYFWLLMGIAFAIPTAVQRTLAPPLSVETLMTPSAPFSQKVSE